MFFAASVNAQNTDPQSDIENKIRVSRGVRTKFEFSAVSSQEIQQFLETNNYTLIHPSQITIKDMGAAGKGAFAASLIRQGSILPYSTQGQIEEVSAQNEGNDTALLLSPMWESSFIYKGKGGIDQARKIAASFKFDEPCYIFLLIIDEIEASLKDKFQAFIVNYSPLLKQKISAPIRQINMQKYCPNLLTALKEGINRNDLIHKIISKELPLKYKIAIFPSPTDNGSKLQHAETPSSMLAGVSSNAIPNFEGLILEMPNEFPIACLKAATTIMPGEILTWSYVKKKYNEENMRSPLVYWDKYGKELDTNFLAFHYTPKYCFLNTLAIRMQADAWQPDHSELAGIISNLYLLPKEAIFALDEAVALKLLKIINYGIKKIPPLHLTFLLKNGIETIIKTMLDDGYLYKKPTQSEINDWALKIKKSPATAIHFSMNHPTEIEDFYRNKASNKDRYFIPIFADGFILESEKLKAKEIYSAEFKSFKQKGMKKYKENDFLEAIYHWQNALKKAKFLAILSEPDTLLDDINNLYWDETGEMATLYRNLGVAYSKFPQHAEEALYCFTKCMRYIELGYSKFFKDPEDISRKYQAAFEQVSSQQSCLLTNHCEEELQDENRLEFNITNL